MKRRLLIIDDDAQFSSFVKRVGEDLGFIAQIEQHPDDFRRAYLSTQPECLFLDMVMPEEDGIEILRWLVKNGCRSNVIVASGYNPLYAEAGKAIADATGEMTVSVLQKPIKLADLRNALGPSSTLTS